MATETWTLSAFRAIEGNAGAVYPSPLTLTVDTDKDFTQTITVKEGGNNVQRTFDCKWVTKGEDLMISTNNGANHHYKGRIHKRTIERGTAASPITHTILAGILGHKSDAYPSSGVGNEDNIVVFTGTT